MNILIKDKEIELKKSIRSYILYENILETAFNPKTIKEWTTFFYCIIISSDKTLELDFEQFLDWVDTQDEGIINNFMKWFSNLAEIENSLSKKKTKTSKKVKQ